MVNEKTVALKMHQKLGTFTWEMSTILFYFSQN